MRAATAAAALVLLVAAAGTAAAAEAGRNASWIEGRATFYDDNQQGSCHYGTNIPEHYAAWPDTLDGFEGSCGRCLEVACRNTNFRDGYGAWQKRSGVCYNEKRSIVVKIVDSCPCHHANAYSNARWCCGDMKHIDLGRAAFKLLAQEKWGVIGLRQRAVDCARLGSTDAAPAAHQAQPGPAPQLPHPPRLPLKLQPHLRPRPWLAGGVAPAWQGVPFTVPALPGRAAALSAVKGLISRLWGGAA